jgi:hypothetical protein
MHARKSRGEWLAIIKAFERSGESHGEFCSARGLNIGSFRTWLYKLRTESAGSADITLLPVEVAMPVAPRAPSAIVVSVAGVEVRVTVGADVGYVAELVAELRSRC